MSRNGRNELVHRQHKTIDDVIEDIDQVSMGKVEQLIEQILSAEKAIALIGKNVK